MINSSNTVSIDGTILQDTQFINMFAFDKNDKFSRWVIRPVMMITALGLGAAILLASAFVAILSLALIPFLAVSYWAVKTKVEREMATHDNEPQSSGGQVAQ